MSSHAATLTVTGAADLAAVVPHILGYPPKRALTVCLLSGGTMREVAAFPLLGLPTAADGPAAADDAAAQIVDVIAGPDETFGEVVPLWFLDSTDQDPGHISRGLAAAALLLAALRRQVAATGPAVDHAGLLDGRRWVTSLCRTADCCIPSGGATADAAAAFRFRRPAPLPDRSALLTELTELSLESTAVAAALTSGLEPLDPAAAFALLIRRARTSADIAAILATLRCDQALIAVAAAASSPESGIPGPAVYELVRAAGPLHRPAAAVVAGAAFWAAGDGPRALTALDVAGDGAAAQLLREMVEAGVPPARVARNLVAVAAGTGNILTACCTPAQTRR
jgi:hypothetical protein